MEELPLLPEGIHAEYRPLTLRFKETAITSRSSMEVKNTYIIRIWHESAPERCGYGEVPLFAGLSAEDSPEFESVLAAACVSAGELPPISSIRFGFESALADLRGNHSGILVDTPFTRGSATIPINGLIWMGTKRRMKERIASRLEAGFRCVKLKIGGIGFEDELELLEALRREFSPDELELRVDANGAFTAENALRRLHRLAKLHLHSIEQPVRQNQPELMARLCRETPLPIALDEELIGFRSDKEKAELLEFIKPQYIILKPSLCGGFAQADSWISIAESLGIGWWATSALESNVGLNAIAQWVSRYNTGSMPQGLGTGSLYTNNFSSPLIQERDYLRFNTKATPSDVDKWFTDTL